tara:strand:- start:232 stop:909 length:678 start_codon:yes stop_codon:yes gene_type:complete
MGSQIGQDIWVIESLKHKKNGFFLDVGCGHPIKLSNTFLLEKQYDWSGIGIDIDLSSCLTTWGTVRNNTKTYEHDALTIDYIKILEENNAPEFIDYLSMDLEPAELTLECLYKIPFDKYKFKTITFETDRFREEQDLNPHIFDPILHQANRHGCPVSKESRADISRKYLEDLGYILMVEAKMQDDFYIHVDYAKERFKDEGITAGVIFGGDNSGGGIILKSEENK